MSKEIQEAIKMQTNQSSFPQQHEIQDENTQKVNLTFSTCRDMCTIPSPENQLQKIDREYDSLNDLTKVTTKKDETAKIEKKLSIKKPKLISIDFNEFLPQFLVFLNHQKHKSVIRIGKNYQADVPQRCSFSHIYRPLKHLKIWTAGQIQPGMLKKFREKFGENRTQEDICMLLYQYQCDWDELNNIITEHKGQLRKAYLQRDRTKI